MTHAPAPSYVRYALLGIPLGFVGLPLYMHLPHHYANDYGVPLATIGALLFFTRLLDCFADPWIGKLLDRFSAQRKRLMIIAAICVSLGMIGLFVVPELLGGAPSFLVIGILLAITYLSYSVLSINYYAFGVPIASNTQQTSRVSAYREAFIALGVLLASTIPLVQSMGNPYVLFAWIFVAITALMLWISWPTFLATTHNGSVHGSPFAILKTNTNLRWIYGIFFLNAIAPSITATLFLFYVEQVLLLPQHAGTFLGVYFLCAILSMPLWSKVSHLLGKRRSLLLSMSTAIILFIWAYVLGADDFWPFLLICIGTGIAYGSDMAVLPSLLADEIQDTPQQSATAYGLWNFVSKFTLALAAGLALPALSWMGYAPQQDNSATIAIAYALLPCMFKLCAVALVFFAPLTHERPLYEKNS